MTFKLSTRRALAALLLALASLSGVAAGQQLSADEVLANMSEQAETLADASFLLTGRLIDSDGTSIDLEVDVEIIPSEEVARATLYQPDVLADNVVIFDGEAIYNYIFMTNQVTIFAADDPDVLGGLLSGQGDGGNFTLTLDLEELFAGWDVTVEEHQDAVYQLRFDNIDPGAALQTVFVHVPEEDWLPRQLRLLDGNDGLVAELFVEDLSRDTGLTVEDVTWLPEDAEVIDERGN